MSDYLDRSADDAFGEPDGASSRGYEYERGPAPQPSADDASPVNWYRLVEWLPRLGSVLWLHRTTGDAVFPRARLAEEGVLLLEHPALAAFSSCVKLQVFAAAGTHGPREWMEWIDANGDCAARMYLLPDTDHFAWDDMVADCSITRAATRTIARECMPRIFRWMRRSNQAQIVRFPLLRLPCLRVLGLRMPGELSALGREIAAAIVRDEAVTMPMRI